MDRAAALTEAGLSARSPTEIDRQARRDTGRAPAIVLGGYTAGLGVIRALGGMGVAIVCVWHDAGEVAWRSSLVDVAIKAPNPDEDEERYVEVLYELEERFGGGLIVPTSDPTVGVVARHKAVLAARCAVACVEW